MKRLLVTVLVIVLLAASAAAAQNPPSKPAPTPAPAPTLSAEDQKVLDLIATYDYGYWLLAMACSGSLFQSYTIILTDFDSHHINTDQAIEAMHVQRQLQDVLLTVSKSLRERMKGVSDKIPEEIDDQIAIAELFGTTFDKAEAFFKKPNEASKKDAFDAANALGDKLRAFLEKYPLRTGSPKDEKPAPKQ